MESSQCTIQKILDTAMKHICMVTFLYARLERQVMGTAMVGGWRQTDVIRSLT